MAKVSPLFTWRSAICTSDLPPTARHVALVVSLYMSERGDSAFPGAARLVNDTGLSLRSVRSALSTIEKADYLHVAYRGGSPKGGSRKATEYVANIPTGEGDAPVKEMHRCNTRHRPVQMTTPTGAAAAPHVVKKAPVNTPSLSEPPSVDSNDRERSIVQEALSIIADRRVEKRKASGLQLINARAYSRTVLADATEELTEELTKRVANNPMWTAEDLASMFERRYDPYDRPVVER